MNEVNDFCQNGQTGLLFWSASLLWRVSPEKQILISLSRAFHFLKCVTDVMMMIIMSKNEVGVVDNISDVDL